MFELHPTLAGDTLAICDLRLSAVRLMRDRRFPWLILVPRRAGLVEITDLAAPERALLIEEVAAAGRVLKACCAVEKLNVGALGNLVSQLHVHVIGRSPGDPAWPGPVWGSGVAQAYEDGAATALAARLGDGLRRDAA